MSTHNSQLTLNDNIEGLANLCQCYDYLAEYPDTEAKETLEHIGKQLEQLNTLAFRKLLFPRIVNYIKTYSQHTMETYKYIEYRIVAIDSTSECPSVTFIECYDYEVEPKPNEQFKITVIGSEFKDGLVPIKLEVFRVDNGGALTLDSCKIHSMTKHDDVAAWISNNM